MIDHLLNAIPTGGMLVMLWLIVQAVAALDAPQNQPLAPVTTQRTFATQVDGIRLDCIETINHAANSRSLAC